MATIDVFKAGGGKAGQIELDPAIFEGKIRAHLFHAEVRRQLAKRRAGTHSTKNRAAVSGGGVKPWKQKGTGRARQGTIRAPQWAGGGVVFGPTPRDYEHRLNKKTRRAALVGALSLRNQEGALVVADGLALNEYKTKRGLELLASLGVAGKSVLVVTAAAQPQLEASLRNLPRVNVIRAEGLNVYDVLRHERLVIAKDAVAALTQRLGEGLGAAPERGSGSRKRSSASEAGAERAQRAEGERSSERTES
jgi:large subunit ribosomal protein L4